MFWSVRNRILVPISTAVGIGIVLSTYFNIQGIVQNENQRIQTQMDDLFTTLAGTSFPLQRSVLVQVEQISGVHLMVLGEQTAETSFREDEAVEKLLEQIPLSPQSSPLPSVHVAGMDYTVFKKSIPARQMTLLAFYPRQQLLDAIRRAIYPQIISGAITLLAVCGLVVWISGNVTSPMQKLKEHLARIAEGDFSESVNDRRDEIGQLICSINEMANRLRVYEQKIRSQEKLLTLDQMGGGIAHQMRNSITGCRLALDFHKQCCDADRESLEVANRQLVFMEEFQKRFLSMARDNNRQRSRIDLGRIVAEHAKLLLPFARHVRVELSVTVPDFPVWILGNESLIQQMTSNLVINAIEAAGSDPDAPPGQVDIRITSQSSRAEMQVSDSGTGIDASVESQIFDPLVTTKADGVGLGLAIVKQSIEEHDGQIEWKRQEGRTSFVIQIPLFDDRSRET